MTSKPPSCLQSEFAPKSWRNDAVQIVEELFPVTSADAWDQLLDLHSGLREGEDWNRTLDFFLACRESLEAEHYLPFYRLRRLLTESLRLEGGADPKTCLKQALIQRHRSLADIRRAISREVFEHDLEACGCPTLRVVEVGAE